MVSVRAFNAQAGLVARDDLSLAQDRDGRVSAGMEAALRAAEQIYQPALAEGETKQF